jgi:hypothetical protein
MFKWFKKKTTQNLPELVERLDQQLAASRTFSGEQNLVVHAISVPLQLQFLGLERQLAHVTKRLPESGGYIPRTVAFANAGTEWQLYIGFRSNTESSDPVAQQLFLNLLNQTNQARSRQ